MSSAVVVDSEWGYRDGRINRESCLEPVVFCALVDGVRHHFLGRDPRLSAFVEQFRDRLWVCHSAPAEMRFLLRLGIPLPPSWWDTMVGYRWIRNCPAHLDARLVTALVNSGLGRFIPAEKDTIRLRILNLAFAQADLPGIIDYCHADVTATASLYAHQQGRVNPVSMAYWTEYLQAVSRIEQRGIAIDMPTLRRIRRNREFLCEQVRVRVNATAKVYRSSGSFCKAAFLRWARAQGIRWPLRPSPKTGKPYHPVDDDTMALMECRHPWIEMVKDAQKTLRALIRHRMMVDCGRHYFSMMPFRSITGRNQPSKFIFSGPKWLRFLAVPSSPDHVLIYSDYSAQEIGIAAALSGDLAMQEMYADDDPHTRYTVMCGADPAERKTYKTVNLATLYEMTELGLADRLGVSEDAASDLLDQHREHFQTYHEWSERVTQVAFDRGYATTRAGWKARVHPESKWRTWSNFPIQSTAADVMRMTTIALDRQGVRVLAIIHDGWLIESRRDEVDATLAAIDRAQRAACDVILGGFELKMTTAIYEGRFQVDEKDALATWEQILRDLPPDWRVDVESF